VQFTFSPRYSVGEVDKRIITMLQIPSVYCVPNIVEIDRRLLNYSRIKMGTFLDHGVVCVTAATSQAASNHKTQTIAIDDPIACAFDCHSVCLPHGFAVRIANTLNGSRSCMGWSNIVRVSRDRSPVFSHRYDAIFVKLPRLLLH